MRALPEALAALGASLAPVAPRIVPLAEAEGKILAEPLRAPGPVPERAIALRDGVAPVGVTRWYPGSDPASTPVTLGVLEAAAARLADTTATWVELVAGRTPEESPGVWCRWCAESDRCPSARTDDVRESHP